MDILVNFLDVYKVFLRTTYGSKIEVFEETSAQWNSECPRTGKLVNMNKLNLCQILKISRIRPITLHCSYTFICNKFKTVYNTTFTKVGYHIKVWAVHQLTLPGRTRMHDEFSEDFLNEERPPSSTAAVHCSLPCLSTLFFFLFSFRKFVLYWVKLQLHRDNC